MTRSNRFVTSDRVWSKDEARQHERSLSNEKDFSGSSRVSADLRARDAEIYQALSKFLPSRDHFFFDLLASFGVRNGSPKRVFSSIHFAPLFYIFFLINFEDVRRRLLKDMRLSIIFN
ncbi:hypothetical protein NPIL_290641 [Nephila pilipes]|uniref:Uncharacterized protein n=1 Tax=Nephila pilipes TaxID=299642 RepID=A0A8X6UR74_NEPPI|nr:hypothetical protein NPIL_290641 [Nephila pilipes]